MACGALLPTWILQTGDNTTVEFTTAGRKVIQEVTSHMIVPESFRGYRPTRKWTLDRLAAETRSNPITPTLEKQRWSRTPICILHPSLLVIKRQVPVGNLVFVHCVELTKV